MKVALGVSGGIAAYKAAEVLRLLQERDVRVQVIMFTGILIVEFRQHRCQFTAVSGEQGTTGIREALVTDTLLGTGQIRVRKYPFYLRPFKRSSGYVEGWFRDPYDVKYRGITLRSVSDDEEYDAQFPDHPLSRLRCTLASVRDSLRFAQAG